MTFPLIIHNLLLLLLLISFAPCYLSRFDPYINHSGTVVGIAGKDYALLASDLRLSEGYMIHSRNLSRIIEVSPGLAVCGSGCWSDTFTLASTLAHNAMMYEWQSLRPIGVAPMSNLLSAALYSKRMFPYFSFSILGGLDHEGRGALYRYDALGSFERVRAVCAGKGEQLMQPSLDSITNMEQDDELWRVEGGDGVFESKTAKVVDLDVDDAIKLVLGAFRSAAEREISIGDGVEVMVIAQADAKCLSSSSFLADDCSNIPLLEQRTSGLQSLKETWQRRKDSKIKTRFFRFSLPGH